MTPSRPANAARPHRRRQAPKALKVAPPKVTPSTLPPLPAISEKLRMKVFAHKSLHGLPTAIEVDETEPLDNERLAFLGASVLQTSVSRLLYRDFPRHRKGWLSDQRTRFVRMMQLAEWSRAYRLPEQLQCHKSATISVRRSQDIQASVFEAYVGAIFLTDGIDALDKWIEPLMRAKGEPYTNGNISSIDEDDAAMKDAESIETDDVPEVLLVSPVQIEHPPPTTVIEPLCHPPEQPSPLVNEEPAEQGYLMLLQERAAQRGITIRWVAAESVLPGCVSSLSRKWTLQANVAGKCIGEGTARTKKAAKEIAAEHALQTLGSAAGLG